jgi:hypothetical protein
MEKSLEILTKKTKNECEQIYRTVVACLNGLAALDIVENKVILSVYIFFY